MKRCLDSDDVLFDGRLIVPRVGDLNWTNADGYVTFSDVDSFVAILSGG